MSFNLKRFGRRAWVALAALAAVVLVALAAAAPAAARGRTSDPCDGKSFEANQLVWRSGRNVPICVNPNIAPARVGKDHFRTVTSFLVAPVDASKPLDDAEGKPPFIPQHDSVTPWDLGGYGRRAACLGFYVVRGPFATPDNVHTRPDPRGASGIPGPPGAPAIEMAYEINLGKGFVPLRSTEPIEIGVVRGMLSLVPVPYPPSDSPHTGSCWVGRGGDDD